MASGRADHGARDPRQAGAGPVHRRRRRRELADCSLSPEAARQIGPFGWGAVQGFEWDPGGDSVYLEVADGNVQNLWKAAVDPGTMRTEIGVTAELLVLTVK